MSSEARRRRRVGRSVLLLAIVATLAAVVLFGVTGIVLGSEPGEEISPSPSPSEEVSPSPSPSEEVSPSPEPGEEVSPSPDPESFLPVTTVVGADDKWHSSAVRLVFVGEDHSGTGLAATEYSIDAGEWRTGTSVVIPAPRTHAWDGKHVVSYRSIDNSGGVEPTKTCVIRIDTTAPRAKWIWVRPAIRTRVGKEEVRVRIKDVSLRATYRLIVVDGIGRTVASQKTTEIRTGYHTFKWNGRSSRGRYVAPGTYGFKLVLRDSAGNRRVTGVKWFRDRHPVASHVVRINRSAGRTVALTFDDCYSSSAWSGILNVLKKHKVKATFFPVGSQVLAKASLARRTVREGHDIGNHSWSHPAMSRLSTSSAIAELRKTEAAWWRVARRIPNPFFRPPYGDYSSATVRAAGRAGYKYTVLWDIDPLDWANPGSAAIVSRVLSRARPGSIILLHTGGQTVSALPAIIRGLKRKNLRPVTLHDMYAAGIR